MIGVTLLNGSDVPLFRYNLDRAVIVAHDQVEKPVPVTSAITTELLSVRFWVRFTVLAVDDSAVTFTSLALMVADPMAIEVLVWASLKPVSPSTKFRLASSWRSSVTSADVNPLSALARMLAPLPTWIPGAVRVMAPEFPLECAVSGLPPAAISRVESVAPAAMSIVALAARFAD